MILEERQEGEGKWRMVNRCKREWLQNKALLQKSRDKEGEAPPAMMGKGKRRNAWRDRQEM